MNHTVVFLASVADVWCLTRDNTHAKPPLTLRSKEWLSLANKKFLPDPSEDQKVILEIVQAIKVSKSANKYLLKVNKMLFIFNIVQTIFPDFEQVFTHWEINKFVWM